MNVKEIKKGDITVADMLFGKKGYDRFLDNKNILVYQRMSSDKLHQQDITFCKDTKGVIFFAGGPYGQDEFRMDYDVLEGIIAVYKQLGWVETGDKKDE